MATCQWLLNFLEPSVETTLGESYELSAKFRLTFQTFAVEILRAEPVELQLELG